LLAAADLLRAPLPAQAQGEDHTEALLQSLHVSKIALGRCVSLPVALHLRIDRETMHLTPANQALAGEGRGWERPAATIRQLEEPVATLVELDRVDVDLSATFVCEDGVRRARPRLHLEADDQQYLLQLRHNRCIHNDIKVSVIARLLAKKGIDTPTSVDPHGNTRVGKRREDFKNPFGIHALHPLPSAQHQDHLQAATQ